MNIYMDDVRSCPLIGFKTVRSVEKTQRYLANGCVEHLSLDHDMCPQSSIGQPPTKPTGMDLVLWMARTGHWPSISRKCTAPTRTERRRCASPLSTRGHTEPRLATRTATSGKSRPRAMTPIRLAAIASTTIRGASAANSRSTCGSGSKANERPARRQSARNRVIPGTVSALRTVAMHLPAAGRSAGLLDPAHPLPKRRQHLQRLRMLIRTVHKR